MGVSIFLSKLIGIYCIIAGLSVFLNRVDYTKLVDDIEQNPSIRFIWAFLALFIGLLIINTHNIWEASWVVIITIFGWISAIKGIMFFMFPGSIAKIGKAYQTNENLLKVNISLMFLLGVFLTYKGYF